MYPYRLIPPADDEEKAIPSDITRHPPSSPTLSSLYNAFRHKSSSSRLSIRKAFAFSCIAGVLYVVAIVFPYHAQRLALAFEAARDTCVERIPPNLHPGDFFKFSNGVKFDEYYIPFLQTSSSAGGWRLPGRWPSGKAASSSSAVAEMPDIPLHCLDNRIALGTPCKDFTDDERTRTLDVVWTYVNGSDPLHKAAYQQNIDELVWDEKRKFRPPIKAGSFREFDELRYSMRSVLKNFRKSAGKLFVVTSDFPFPGCDGSSGWRLGQLPQWLVGQPGPVPQSWQDGNLTLSVVHHHSIFNALHNHSVFNSLAIESRLGQVQGVSDHFIYMNDDVFFNGELSTFDFYTKAHGPVFRVQPDLLVSGDGDATGEWIALKRSNQLLDGRFGKRSRPYLAHLAKTLSTSMLQELSVIYPADFNQTASHAFRSRISKSPDIHTAFLMSHYVVERWREMLLWSYIVGGVGDWDAEGDGEAKWTHEHHRRLWRDLVGGRDEELVVEVERMPRSTLARIKEEWEMMGIQPRTKYSFSSFDGYPYTDLGGSPTPTFYPKFRKFQPADPKAPIRKPGTCSLSQDCFKLPDGVPFTASEVFKHVAFREPQCGDCMITALINRSGQFGLDAFLPESKRKFPSTTSTVVAAKHLASFDNVPRLPLTADWESVDFSLGAVNPLGLTVREWVLRALHRYRFVLGDTTSTFVQLDGISSAKRKLAMVDMNKQNPPAIVCVNDDVTYSIPQVRQVFVEWMNKRWNTPAQWEMRVAKKQKIPSS